MNDTLQPKTSRIIDLINWGRELFLYHDLPHPRYNIEVLLECVLRKRRIDLYLDYDYRLSPDELKRLKGFVEKRLSRWPLWHLVGTVEFFGLKFRVSEHVLIPRPETELVVELALKELARDTGGSTRYVADIGTGSGNIAVSTVRLRSDLFVYATDISREALAIASENARLNGVEGCISFMEGHLLDPFKARGRNRLDMILSNPPYVSAEEWADLPSEVKDREPRAALFGGEDGMEVLRELVVEAPLYLRTGGCMILETGRGQAGPVRRLIEGTGYFEPAEIHKDYSGIERVVLAQRNDKSFQ
jgi:release factor glutamine methyltransferase